MWFSFWLRNRKRFAPTARRRTRTTPHQQANFRPTLEILEDRMVPSSGLPYPTAANESQLIADINAANKAGGSNTITLATNTTFDLTAVNNTTNGANGLPVISGGGKMADNLTIFGNGDIIERSTAGPAFRLFDVAPGASLTLNNVTLLDGWAFGSGAAADGGAIYNQGTLTLQNTIVQNNTAQGSNGVPPTFTKNNKLINAAQASADAEGGGIYNQGTLTLQQNTIVQNNTALGGNGAPGGTTINGFIAAGAGADAEGGGIWTNGTVKLEAGTIIGSTNVSSSPFGGEGNQAIGGGGGVTFISRTVSGITGGAGGGGFGGGLYQAGGSVTITNATVVGNLAAGGTGGTVPHSPLTTSLNITGNGGAAAGGGVDVVGGTLFMSNDPVKTNFAQGALGGLFNGESDGGTGGSGSGGGIYVGGGTVTLQAINLSGNQATGGEGGYSSISDTLGFGGFGGNGLGGGLYVGGGAVTMTGSTVTNNRTAAGASGSRFGVPNGSPGVAAGGIFIVAPASVSLDSFTVTNTTQNYVDDIDGFIETEDDIDGSYTLI